MTDLHDLTRILWDAAEATDPGRASIAFELAKRRALAGEGDYRETVAYWTDIAAAILRCGWRPPAPAVVAASARDAFGVRTGQAAEGMAVQIMHGISATDYERDGELALLWWIRQALREAAVNGADPGKAMTITLQRTADGDVLLTAEAAL